MPDALPVADTVQLAETLCNIYSVSGSEREIADRIEATLIDLAPGLTRTRTGDTLIARTNLGRKQRVILAGHLDTVPVNENLPVRRTIDPETGEPVLWGRGTVDMKSGVAVMLSLACTLDLDALPVDVTWVWYDHEEVGSELNGLRRAVEEYPQLLTGDLAILAEPSGGTIEGGCNGTLQADIEFFGTRAHSARSWTGVNAIHRAHEALEALSNYDAPEVLVEGLSYREGLNAVAIDGGVAGNVIPDLCRLRVNYRFAPNRGADEAEDFIRSFFSMADRVTITDVMPGARPGLTHPLVQSLVAATGSDPQAKLGWTDVARFSELGIPAVNFGPGIASRSHTDDERIAISDIENTRIVLEHWLTNT